MFRQGVHDPKSLFDDSGKNILLKDAKVSLCIDNELGTEKLNERVCGHEQNIPDTCLQKRWALRLYEKPSVDQETWRVFRQPFAKFKHKLPSNYN